MYKRITLEKFERGKYCEIPDSDFENIRSEIEYNIGILNEGIAEGRYYLDMYMEAYNNNLYGMTRVCSMIGIKVKINREKVDKIETKGDEVGTTVNN